MNVSDLLARARRMQPTIAVVVAALVIVSALVALPPSDDAEIVSQPRASAPSTVTSEADAAVGREPRVATPTSRSATSIRGTTTRPTVDAPGTTLPPVNKRVIKVGITYTEDPGGAEAAAGIGGGGFIDERRGWEAVVRDVNKKLPYERKVVPVWFSISENDAAADIARAGQNACARFTQDNHVDFVWTGSLLSGDESLATCLTKKKIPEISFGTGLSSRATFARHPYLIEPTSAAMDRMAEFYVDELVHAKFFTSFKDNEAPYTPAKPADGKSRIGLIRYDTPAHIAGTTALKKRLASHGLKLCTGCEFEVHYSASNLQHQLDDSSEVNAAIQACKGSPDGPCTHMLLLGASSQRIPVFFMDGAERQAYRPRIGFSPLDSWTFARDFIGGESTDSQFRQSLLVTWSPFDFLQHTATFTRCKKLFTDAGEDFSGDDARDKEAQIPPLCDTGAYFTSVMSSVGRTLDLPSWTKAVHTVDQLPAAGAYGIRTTSDRRDGIGAVRVGTWSDGCTCFKPVTPIRSV